LKKCLWLAIIACTSIAFAAVGDALINAWGTLNYGWIDDEKFAIQYQGSAHVRQIEHDRPQSVLFITNDARRPQDNLYAWQFRKGPEGDLLSIVPYDFAWVITYELESEAQGQEGEEGQPLYSAFKLAIPKLLESHKLISPGDQLTIHLSWDPKQPLFSFTVPAPPDTIGAPQD